jgi:hypothetical protein
MADGDSIGDNGMSFFRPIQPGLKDIDGSSARNDPEGPVQPSLA